MSDVTQMSAAEIAAYVNYRAGMQCSHCGTLMHWWNGLDTIPAGLICPVCNDGVYDFGGAKLAALEE